MFEHVLFLGIAFPDMFLIFILVLLAAFIGIFLFSLYRNRKRVNFYSLVVRENGRISKIGVAFIFILMLLIYQVISDTEISTYLVELLGVIFAAELGTKYVDGKISQNSIDSIRNNLSLKDKAKETAPAKNVDNIDFNNL